MLYSWQHPESLIHRAEIYQPSKYAEAVLYAPEGADPAKLQQVNHQLKAAGFNTVADVENGAPVLHVIQIESPEKLLSSLQQTGGVMGPAVTQQTRRDLLYQKNPLQKLKENAASTAGYIYVLADALMMVSGVIRAKGLQKKDGGISEVMTGLAWAIPNLNLAINGKKDPRYQSAALMDGFHKYVEQQGIEVPEGEALTIDSLTKKNGLLDAAHRFLSDNAITINNTGEAIGGLMMTRAGWQQRPGLSGAPYNSGQPNVYKMFAGNCVTTGMGLSVLLPEKKAMMHLDGSPVEKKGTQIPEGDLSIPAEAQPQQDAKSGLKQWFRTEILDHPMRLAGYLPIGNNIANLYGSLVWEPKKLKHFKEHEYDIEKARLNSEMAKIPVKPFTELPPDQRKNILGVQQSLDGLEQKLKESDNYKKGASLNAMSAGLFILANLTYSTASKNGGSKLEKAGGLNNLLAVAANVVAAQPAQKQASLMEHMAAALAAEKEICVPENEIAEALKVKVAALAKNPWAERVRAVPPAGTEHSGPYVS